MPPKVLLTSVFKPFGVDSVHSRRESKIELYHNQLTKAQGIFSMRGFMNSFGLHAIANNIDAPAAVLDFPTLKRFRRELKKGYDIVGIGAIMPNFQKVKIMAEEIRELSPRSAIVIGGFCAAIPDLGRMLDVDHICIGDGITFMRDLTGMPSEFTFKNPDVFAESRELLGVPIHGVKNPHVIVGLGCSYGCEFCCPSHFFGRKHVKFYTDGRALFDEICRVEKRFNSDLVCLIGDDNFLLDLKRADELRQAAAEKGKALNIMIFGSSDRVQKYGAEKLAEMGVGTIWIGRESRIFEHKKNKGADIESIVGELRSYGIKTILSSILYLEGHTPENVAEDVGEHIRCNPAFSQFSHLSPMPGTSLYDRMSEEGKILNHIPFEEWHAFKQPWYHHPLFTLKEAERIQEEAYQRDFRELGPSLLRFIEVDHEGWRNLRDSENPLFRARAEKFASRMWQYKILLAAMEGLVPEERMRDKVRDVRDKVESDFGPLGAAGKTIALGLHAAGRAREARTALFGDALQPPTRLTRYNHKG